MCGMQCKGKDMHWYKRVDADKCTAMLRDANMSEEMGLDVKFFHLVPRHLCWDTLDQHFIYEYKTKPANLLTKVHLDEMRTTPLSNKIRLE